MGLDMYAISAPKEVAGDQQVGIRPGDIPVEKLAYWRKFNQLHGWMEDLYRAKGGTEEFNCTTVRLESEDLDRLEIWLKEDPKESRPGFFFGSGQIYPEDIEDTEKFIKDARQALSDGRVVLYDSWW